MKKYLLLLILLLLCQIQFQATAEIEATKVALYHIVDINHPTPLKVILARYKAIQTNGENISDTLSFETEYSESTCKVQKYELYVTLNKDGLSSYTQKDYIWVIDFEAPKLSISIEALEHNLDQPLRKEDIEQYLSFTDNYDIAPYEIIMEGFEDLIEAGDYQLILYALDSSKNKSNTIVLPIHLSQSTIDIIIQKEFNLNTFKYSREEIINLFLKENKIDPEYESISAESNYFSSTTPGIFTLTIIVKYKEKTYLYHAKINVQNKTSPSQNLTILYISFGVLGTLILISIIIYKKRG